MKTFTNNDREAADRIGRSIARQGPIDVVSETSKASCLYRRDCFTATQPSGETATASADFRKLRLA